MKTHENELNLIKDLLRINPRGMKITRIAHELAMNRNAAAKYLEILLMTGQVEVIEHGMSKIFILSRRTGIPTMLDRSSDFILILDNDMKISQVNDNYIRFAGLKREDLLGKKIETSGLPVISSRTITGKIREARLGADIRTETEEIISGEEFFFDARITPTVFNNGSRGITIIFSNITEEKKKEMQLRKSEADFRTLFGKSPVGTAVFDAGGDLTNANPAFLATLGVTSRNELALLKLFSEEGIASEMQDELRKGNMVKISRSVDGIRFLHPGSGSGDRPHVPVFEFRVTPVSLTSGERNTGYLVQVMESPVKQTVTANDDTSILSEILSCIDEAVILVDYPSGSISFVNRPAENVFGYGREEFMKENPALILGHRGSMQEYFGALSGSFRDRGFFESEPRLMRRNGEDFRAKQHCRPIYGKDGQIRNIVMVITDMTRVRNGGENLVGDERLVLNPSPVFNFSRGSPT